MYYKLTGTSRPLSNEVGVVTVPGSASGDHPNGVKTSVGFRGLGIFVLGRRVPTARVVQSSRTASQGVHSPL